MPIRGAGGITSALQAIKREECQVGREAAELTMNLSSDSLVVVGLRLDRYTDVMAAVVCVVCERC